MALDKIEPTWQQDPTDPTPTPEIQPDQPGPELPQGPPVEIPSPEPDGPEVSETLPDQPEIPDPWPDQPEAPAPES